MMVVADSGPLIALARVRRFPLLHELYQTVAIPSQVYDEVVTERALSGSTDVAAAAWCRVIVPMVDITDARRTYPHLQQDPKMTAKCAHEPHLLKRCIIAA